MRAMYREVEALGGAVIMDDYEEGYRDALEAALAVLRKYGFGVDMAPTGNEEKESDDAHSSNQAQRECASA